MVSGWFPLAIWVRGIKPKNLFVNFCNWNGKNSRGQLTGDFMYLLLSYIQPAPDRSEAIAGIVPLAENQGRARPLTRKQGTGDSEADARNGKYPIPKIQYVWK